MFTVKIKKILCDCGYVEKGKDMEEPFYESSLWECPNCGNEFSILRYTKEEK